MMSREQLLLLKLAEEGVEVAQIASKTMQFGQNEICPNLPFTNAERTHQEIDDLMGIIEMLNEEFNFGYAPSRERIEAKKLKVNRYAEYAVKLGQVEPPNQQDEKEENPISQ